MIEFIPRGLLLRRIKLAIGRFLLGIGCLIFIGRKWILVVNLVGMEVALSFASSVWTILVIHSLVQVLSLMKVCTVIIVLVVF